MATLAQAKNNVTQPSKRNGARSLAARRPQHAAAAQGPNLPGPAVRTILALSIGAWCAVIGAGYLIVHII